MRSPCSTAPVRIGQMCPPLRVKRWLTPARFRARAMSSPVAPESPNALRHGHGRGVECRLRLALPWDQDHPARSVHGFAEVLDRAFGDEGGIHPVLELDDHELGQAQPDEGLA